MSSFFVLPFCYINAFRTIKLMNAFHGLEFRKIVRDRFNLFEDLVET